MKEKYKTMIKLLCVILLLIWATYVKFEHRSEYEKLKSSHYYTIGVVDRISSKPRTWRNYFCYYHFVDGRDTVKGYVIKYLDNSRSEFLGNREFPVAFEKGNVKNNEMLFFKEDFEKYGIKYPDSLRVAYESLGKKM